METEIRACPFCGGEAHAALAAYAGGATAHVVCDGCGAKVYGYGRGELGLRDAVESWNRRAERTCRVVRGGEPSQTGVPRERRCSECGGTLTRFGSYCHHCGARVVGDDDR